MAMGGEEKLRIVKSLYEGLAVGDTEAVAALLAADLEWWFHGPPGCKHMMRILTGKVMEEEEVEFRFEPRKVVEVGKWVVAEGWEGAKAYWVHLWAVDDGGVITQFREYFNTWVTVQELGRPVQAQANAKAIGWTGRAAAVPTVWQSETQEQLGRSLPGLFLAI